MDIFEYYVWEREEIRLDSHSCSTCHRQSSLDIASSITAQAAEAHAVNESVLAYEGATGSQ